LAKPFRPEPVADSTKPSVGTLLLGPPVRPTFTGAFLPMGGTVPANVASGVPSEVWGVVAHRGL
jgi:hypothetical protein